MSNAAMGESYSQKTLVTAVIVSLILGFVGGAMYSSFKLADNASMHAESGGETDDHSNELKAKILNLELHVKENPDDAQAWTTLGNYLYDTKQPVKAIHAYERSLELAPGRTGVLTDLGYMYLVNEQPGKAIEMFDKALAVDPSFEPALLNKGVALVHVVEDVEGGIKVWEELVRINPMAKTPTGEPVKLLIERMRR